jgi:hydroxymethylpyrimidine/phosphomethylpyrimidine kinase
MKIPILSINGSDSSGQSGIGADIQTIAALGGYAVSAVTCIGDYTLPSDVVLKQAEKSISTLHPKAIKAGLVTDSETVRMLHDEVIACRRLVVAPGIYDAEGRQMVSDDVIEAIARYLVPEALLLMLRCRDAEKMLGISIRTDDDMLDAARRLHEMGAEWVLLRGARHIKGRLIALLYGQNKTQFFSSYNTEGWQKHGVAGALSAAITTRLGMGDDVPTAVRNAHDFIHSQVVYAKPDEMGGRSIDIYNRFVSLVAEHYRTAHDVAFYADRLCITTRYLSQITDKVVGKSPKQVIADYIMSEAKTFLDTTCLTIQEIADRLGFSSQVLFCKFFKSQDNMSPSDYRKQ